MSENENENQQPNGTQQDEVQPEEIHTAAEADLVAQVTSLRQEIANLREENRKLFLRIGGEDKPQTKTPDEEIKEILSGFRASGYNPAELMKE